MKASYYTSDRSRQLLDMRKSVEVQVDSDFALLLPSGAYEIKKMEPRHRLRSIVFICLMLAVAGIIGFGYFCPDQVNNQKKTPIFLLVCQLFRWHVESEFPRWEMHEAQQQQN